jgi:hypothetical protein
MQGHQSLPPKPAWASRMPSSYQPPEPGAPGTTLLRGQQRIILPGSAPRPTSRGTNQQQHRPSRAPALYQTTTRGTKALPPLQPARTHSSRLRPIQALPRLQRAGPTTREEMSVLPLTPLLNQTVPRLLQRQAPARPPPEKAQADLRSLSRSGQSQPTVSHTVGTQAKQPASMAHRPTMDAGAEDQGGIPAILPLPGDTPHAGLLPHHAQGKSPR